jgi:hypothetical protein
VPTWSDDPGQFGEGTRQVMQVSKEEGTDGSAEAPVAKGKAEGASLYQREASRESPPGFGHHRRAQIHPDHRVTGRQQRAQASGPASEVQDPTARDRLENRCRGPPPPAIHAEREHIVQQVVSVDETVEHRPDAPLVGRLPVNGAFSQSR